VAVCRSCVNWRFSGTRCLHLGCSHLLKLVPPARIFLPWRWRQCFPPKRQFTQDLHAATSQKTAFFIVTAVKTSNLTWESFDPLFDGYMKDTKNCDWITKGQTKRRSSRLVKWDRELFLFPLIHANLHTEKSHSVKVWIYKVRARCLFSIKLKRNAILLISWP
jgi:hypothetical protein